MTDPAHVRHLAALARLSLTDEEAARFADEATRILAAFEALPRGDAGAGAAPDQSAGRADAAAPAAPEVVAAILAQVPRKDGRRIVVPRGGEGL